MRSGGASLNFTEEPLLPGGGLEPRTLLTISDRHRSRHAAVLAGRRIRTGCLRCARLAPRILHPLNERLGDKAHYDFGRGSRGFRGARAKEQRCGLYVDAGTIALDE